MYVRPYMHMEEGMRGDMVCVRFYVCMYMHVCASIYAYGRVDIK